LMIVIEAKLIIIEEELFLKLIIYKDKNTSEQRYIYM